MTGLRDRVRRLSPDDRRKLESHLATQEERVGPIAICQRGMWFVEQLSPHTPAYLVPGALRLRGNVRRDLLQEAVDQLVMRHEALRTTFCVRDGEPVQIVHPSVGYLMPIVKRQAEEAEIAPMVADLLLSEPMDVTTETFRAVLVELGPDDLILGWVTHHLVSDRWSVGIMIEDLGEIYRSLVEGGDPELPPLFTQPLDFSERQRREEADGSWSRSQDFWREELRGAPPALDLPCDQVRPSRQGFRGAMLPFRLGEELSADVAQLARRVGATSNMVVLAAYATVLWRWSSQDDIVIGTPMVLRDAPDLERIVGYFINPLAMRCQVSGEESFGALLERVRSTVLRAYDHKEVPFDVVVSDAEVTRDLARSPLFQMSLSYGRQPQLDLELPDIMATPVQIPTAACRFDLELQAFETAEGIQGWFEYDVEVLDEQTVSRISAALILVLEAACVDSSVRLCDLAMETIADRLETAATLTGADVDWPACGWVHDLIGQRAGETPEAVAVVFEDESLTYAELDRASNFLARRLLEAGVCTAEVVAIAQERSLELVVSILAVLKAGAAYLPIPVDIPAARVTHILADSGAALTLVSGATRAVFTEIDGPPLLEVDDVLSVARVACDTACAPVVVDLRGESPAYVIYTSGSTGTPKGVVNTHRGLKNRLLWMQDRYNLDAEDVVLQKTPYSFDVSVWEFLWPLMCGARLVVAKPQGHRDTRYLADVIRSEQVTTLHFVPSMLALFLAEDVESCSSLRRVVCSGEALGREVQDEMLRRSGAELHNLYGPTEAAIDVTSWQCVLDPDDRRTVPIGRPIANTRLAVVDQQLVPVPRGVTGELVIAGDNVALGYVNQPDLTSERFVECRAMGERCYRTGDVVRLREDGQIEYRGRLDHQVKIRGLRIEMGEIEAVLRACDGVGEAVVLAHEFAPGDVRLLAYVVCDAARVEPAVLRTELRTQLPEYMVPNQVHVLSALPLTSNGKLDRAALPRGIAHASRAVDIPKGDLETTIAAIWAELIGAPVGRHDNFFDVGGHSLLLAALRERLQPMTATPIEMVDLFRCPTVSTQAALLQHTEGPVDDAASRRAQKRKQSRRAGR